MEHPEYLSSRSPNLPPVEMSPPIAIAPTWLERAATQVAPALVGCTLVRQLPDRTVLRGMIVETEAYEPDDPAMHAYRRQTARNAPVFAAAGIVYVYQIYGIYHCLNVVTDRAGIPSAVLIRALSLDVRPPEFAPISARKLHRIAAGPGKLCQVLQIDVRLNASPLQPGQPLWLEPRSPEFQQQLETGVRSLCQTTRIGLTRGTDRPWRWYLADSPAVSQKAANLPKAAKG